MENFLLHVKKEERRLKYFSLLGDKNKNDPRQIDLICALNIYKNFYSIFKKTTLKTPV